MFFRHLLILTLAAFSFSQDEGTVALENVYRLGDCEKVGLFSSFITGNTFPNASVDQPVYLKVHFLPDQSVLCQTLVDLDAPGKVHQPIFLKLTLYTSTDFLHMAAPGHAVSIVRWRKGENAIWLKVTVPTSAWLTRDGVLTSPSAESSVSLELGLDGTTTRKLGVEGTGNSNLSFTSLADGTLAATEIRLDLNRSLSPGTQELTLGLDLYDHLTQGVESEETIQLGNHLGSMGWPAGFTIARVFESPNFRSRLVFPWVSHNSRFTSQISVQNRAPHAVVSRWQLQRQDGTVSQTVEKTLSAWSSFQGTISEIFPEWTEGSGASLVIDATERSLEGTWFTYFREGCSALSPAANRAVRFGLPAWFENSSNQDQLEFGTLALDARFFTSVVLVNLNEQAKNVELTFLNQEGQVVHRDSTTAVGLLSNRPYAWLLSDLLPPGIEASQLLVTKGGQGLVGTLFLFNEEGDPAMIPARPFEWSIPLLQPPNAP